MTSTDKTPFVKPAESAEQNSTYRMQRVVRKLPRKAVTFQERVLLYVINAHLRLGRGVSASEFRVSASELADAVDWSVRTVFSARTALEKRGVIVCTNRGDKGRRIPPTYRVDFAKLEAMLPKGRHDQEEAPSGQTRPAPVADVHLNDVQVSPAPVADVHLHQLHTLVLDNVAQVESPDGDCAADAAPPSGRLLPGGGEEALDESTLEDFEPPTAPSLHLATTVQEGPTGSRVPGRLSAASGSSWVLTDEEKPASVVRVKSPGKKTPKPAPASSAGSSGTEVPPARPQTSVRSTPRALPASGPGPLSVRTPFSAPAGAPAPRTVPPYPSVTAVWSGNAAGAAPPFSPDERDFLARYTAAEKLVRAAKLGIGCDLLDGEALGDLCARTFAEHFPRGYSVELLAFKASRTLALKDAHALHEAAEARRRAREAEEEALAERAHKKKKSA